MYVYKSTVESGVANAAFRAILLAAQSHAVPAEGKALFRRVSRCVRFFSEGRVCVPAFGGEGKRGPFVREVENAMKSGLKQRCGGNFLAIFAGVSIGEKPNFSGRFFEWRRPFDKSTR